MRRRLVLGVGLAGVLTGSAVGQFAADRVPAGSPPAPPVVSGYVPPVWKKSVSHGDQSKPPRSHPKALADARRRSGLKWSR